MSKDSLEKRIEGMVTKVINPKIGAATGLIGATYAFFVNYSSGFSPAIMASGKQFLSSFLLGGFIGKTTQYFAKIKNPYLAWTLGEIVPALMANGIFYAVHKLSGTPEPLKSIILPAVIGLTIYSPTIIYLTRKDFLK